METARIAQIIDEMGTMLEIKGENPFRCRAYHTAAQSLMNLPADLSEMIADGRLTEVPGIGETMHAKIVQLATTGQLPAYEELRRGTPPGLVALLRVPGLGPKKIKALHEELKIESLADLRAAAESGQIAGLKGFGDKTQTKILEGIAFVEKAGERILQSHAHAAGGADRRGGPRPSPGHPGRGLRQPAPSRRDDRRPGCPVQLQGPRRGARRVRRSCPRWPRCSPTGPTKASVRLADGVQCDLRGVEDDQFAFAPALFHRLEGAQHRDAQAGAGPRAFAQRVRLGRRRQGRSACQHRGRGVRGARAGRHPARAARGRRGDRGRRERASCPI